MSDPISITVTDKNGQQHDATTIVDVNGHTVDNALNDQPMAAPSDYSPA